MNAKKPWAYWVNKGRVYIGPGPVGSIHGWLLTVRRESRAVPFEEMSFDPIKIAMGVVEAHNRAAKEGKT